MRIPHHLLRETITIEDYSGQGARGTHHTAPRSTVAAVEPSGKLVTSSRGTETVVELLASIRPEAGPVAVDSIVTWAGRRYRVVSAQAMPDTRRPTHWELGLSAWAG